MKIWTVLLPLLVLCVAHALTAAEIKSHWEYKLEKAKTPNPVVNTVRYSLLVANPGQTGESKIEVKSACKNHVSAEPIYGDCEHRLFISPTRRSLTLKTGEAVGLAYFGGFNDAVEPAIATITYGCCAGPNQVTFYSYDGTKWGGLETFASLYPHIDRIWNLNNVADHTYVFLVDSADSSFSKDTKAVVLKKEAGHAFSKETAQVTIAKPGDCNGWTLNEFIALKPSSFGLSVRFYECEPGVWAGKCVKKGAEWKCELLPNKPNEFGQIVY